MRGWRYFITFTRAPIVVVARIIGIEFTIPESIRESVSQADGGLWDYRSDSSDWFRLLQTSTRLGGRCQPK
jgi:hypothetical protein